MASIAYRLYISHNVEKPKFGLLELFLASVLLALPLIFANWTWELLISGSHDQTSKAAILTGLSMFAMLLLYPILLVAEATLSLLPRSLMFRILRQLKRQA